MEGRRIGNLREAFDPSCDFFTLRPIVVGGRPIQTGALFPKDSVDLRRLRQLYDTRYLRQEHSQEERIERIRSKPIVEIGLNPGPPAQPSKAEKIKAAKKKVKAA